MFYWAIFLLEEQTRSFIHSRHGPFLSGERTSLSIYSPQSLFWLEEQTSLINLINLISTWPYFYWKSRRAHQFSPILKRETDEFINLYPQHGPISVRGIDAFINSFSALSYFYKKNRQDYKFNLHIVIFLLAKETSPSSYS